MYWASQVQAYFLMKRKTRLWLRFILILMLAGGVYLLLRNYEQEFVYAPSAFVKKTPREAGMAFDNIALVSDDGVNIQGWFVPAQPPEQAPATNSAPPTLLFFHGKTGNIGDCLEKIHLFHDMGLDVFTIDYHGYGKSGGAPTERALTGDALAAYFYLAEKRNVKPERLYIYGEDLGRGGGHRSGGQGSGGGVDHGRRECIDHREDRRRLAVDSVAIPASQSIRFPQQDRRRAYPRPDHPQRRGRSGAIQRVAAPLRAGA